MRTLKEICDAIEHLCSPEVLLEVHRGVDPTLVRRSAQDLLQFGRDLTSVPASSTKAAVSGDVSPDVDLDVDQHGLDAVTVTLPATKQCRSVVGRCWADVPVVRGNTVSCAWVMTGTALIVLLTAPYYVCATYKDWFIDEGFAIYRNPDARGETPIFEVLKHDFWGSLLNPPEGYITHKSWRPLITLLYAAEWSLAKRYGWLEVVMQPMRILSCLIHTLNSLLVLRLLYCLRVDWRWTLFGAALFATHPIHIENIVYLVGRADALATTFYLLALLCYLKGTLGQRPSLRVGSYIALTLLTVIGGLCKEPAFTALFFIACAELVLRQRCRHVFGFLVCFVAVGSLRTWYVGGTQAEFGYVDTPVKYQESKLTRTLTYLYQHAFYAKLLVLPWNQSWDYSYDALPMLESFVDVRILAIVGAYLAVAGLGAGGLKRRREKPTLLFGLGLVIIPFVPASNLLFLVGTTVGERLLYPSSVGWVMLVISALPPPATASACLRRSRCVGMAVLLVLYIYNSNVRMWQWRHKAALFGADAKHWGRSSKVLHQYAVELQARHDLHGALDHYMRSLEVFDDQALTDYCIARILIHLERYHEAYQRFLKIINGHGIGFHDQNEFLWMTDLGYTLVWLGEFQQGAHWLQEGLQRMPMNCFGWNALGVAQARSNQLEQAVQSLSSALECEPTSAITWNNLAVVYAFGNAGQQALQAFQQATSLNASHPTITFNALVFAGQAQSSARPRFDLYIPLAR